IPRSRRENYPEPARRGNLRTYDTRAIPPLFRRISPNQTRVAFNSSSATLSIRYSGFLGVTHRIRPTDDRVVPMAAVSTPSKPVSLFRLDGTEDLLVSLRPEQIRVDTEVDLSGTRARLVAGTFRTEVPQWVPHA